MWKLCQANAEAALLKIGRLLQIVEKGLDVKGTVTRFCACAASWFLSGWRFFKFTVREENLFPSSSFGYRTSSKPCKEKTWWSFGDSSGVYVYIFENSLTNWMSTREGPWGGVRSSSGRKLLSPRSRLVSKGRDKKTKKQWNEDHRRITVARDVYENWRKMKCMCVYSSDTAFAQHLLSLEMRRRAG